LKFIGKEEQRRTELKIQTLQSEVVNLQRQLQFAQLSIDIAKQEGGDATTAMQAELDLAKQALDDAHAQLSDTQAQLAAANQAVTGAQTDLGDKIKALEGQIDAKNKEHAGAQAIAAKAMQEAEAAMAAAQATAAKAKQEGEAALAAAQAAAQSAATAAKAQLDAQLDAKAKELAAAQATAAKAKQEDEAAMATAKAATAAAQAAAASAKAQLDAQLDAKSKELATAQATAAKAKQDGEAAMAAVKAEAAKAVANAAAAAKAVANAAAAAKAEAAKAIADATVKLDSQAKELTALKAERDKQAKLAQQTEAKFQDGAQENELLLLQLMQAQEELVEYYEQKGEFEKLYQAYKARWDRLEKRLPNYLDFGAITIVDVDGVSDVPSITWQVKDFAQAGVALSEFGFVTVLQDGHPGIGLVKDGQPHAFVPKLLGANKDQLDIFLGLGNTEFKQLTAAVSILDQFEAGQWAGFDFPKQFDLSFWRPSLKALISQLRLLPVLLRFDEVRLKRELINPDYEHLWLEFRGLGLGAAQWKKFEIRLGAALVQADGFSQYPKFEIPLIDGKTKPFESWFAESQDDSGAKLELRFALDKNVFDTAVWTKLSDADKALVLRMIYAMPVALKRLEQEKVAIHRPWATWIDFASGAVKVLQANKAAAKAVTAQPALEVDKVEGTPKTLPAPATPAPSAPALSTLSPVASPPAASPLVSSSPAKLTNTGAKAGKVISITAKPLRAIVAKPKPKAVAKTSKPANKPLARSASSTVDEAKA
jgi:hypothetical protein